MRKALCVGVNFYITPDRRAQLPDCVSDAESVAAVLRRNGDNSINFSVDLLLAKDYDSYLSKAALTAAVQELFADPNEVALFYFAGHGMLTEKGGYLCPSDIAFTGEGFALSELMDIVADSPAKHKIIILDSCHSGSIADIKIDDKLSSLLPENTTLISACRSEGVSMGGVFTPLMNDALTGGAMNLLGEVTPGGIYSYVERALDAWDQRPVFKANNSEFICLRKNDPPVDLGMLLYLPKFFKNAKDEFPLDPSYEEDKRDVADKTHNLEHEADFKILRKFASLNLLVPVGEEYMYQAAVNSKSCKLTALGRYYWNLVYYGKI